jgi:hypothetical protein
MARGPVGRPPSQRLGAAFGPAGYFFLVAGFLVVAFLPASFDSPFT